ncbi:photosystem II stability/assembly factor HCF136, chloroplastic [Tanacetum coccineum]
MALSAKLLIDASSNPITSIKPSSILNSLFNHRHPRTLPQQQPTHHQQRTIKACAVNSRREFITDTAAAAAALSLAGLVDNSKLSVAKAADALSEWERVYLPIDPGVVLLDIAFVPDDPSHGLCLREIPQEM